MGTEKELQNEGTKAETAAPEVNKTPKTKEAPQTKSIFDWADEKEFRTRIRENKGGKSASEWNDLVTQNINRFEEGTLERRKAEVTHALAVSNGWGGMGRTLNSKNEMVEIKEEVDKAKQNLREWSNEEGELGASARIARAHNILKQAKRYREDYERYDEDDKKRVADLYERMVTTAQSLYAKEAEERNNPCAHRMLGHLYDSGRIDSPDERASEKVAFDHFQRAADQEDADSEYMLGRYYALGIGCEPDDSLAKFWLTLASQHGNSEAGKFLKGMDGDDSFEEYYNQMPDGTYSDDMTTHEWFGNNGDAIRRRISQDPNGLKEWLSSRPIQAEDESDQTHTLADIMGLKTEKDLIAAWDWLSLDDVISYVRAGYAAGPYAPDNLRMVSDWLLDAQDGYQSRWDEDDEDIPQIITNIRNSRDFLGNETMKNYSRESLTDLAIKPLVMENGRPDVKGLSSVLDSISPVSSKAYASYLLCRAIYPALYDGVKAKYPYGWTNSSLPSGQEDKQKIQTARWKYLALLAYYAEGDQNTPLREYLSKASASREAFNEYMPSPGTLLNNIEDYLVWNHNPILAAYLARAYSRKNNDVGTYAWPEWNRAKAELRAERRAVAQEAIEDEKDFALKGLGLNPSSESFITVGANIERKGLNANEEKKKVGSIQIGDRAKSAYWLRKAYEFARSESMWFGDTDELTLTKQSLYNYLNGINHNGSPAGLDFDADEIIHQYLKGEFSSGDRFDMKHAVACKRAAEKIIEHIWKGIGGDGKYENGVEYDMSNPSEAYAYRANVPPIAFAVSQAHMGAVLAEEGNDPFAAAQLYDYCASNLFTAIATYENSGNSDAYGRLERALVGTSRGEHGLLDEPQYQVVEKKDSEGEDVLIWGKFRTFVGKHTQEVRITRSNYWTRKKQYGDECRNLILTAAKKIAKQCHLRSSIYQMIDNHFLNTVTDNDKTKNVYRVMSEYMDPDNEKAGDAMNILNGVLSEISGVAEFHLGQWGDEETIVDLLAQLPKTRAFLRFKDIPEGVSPKKISDAFRDVKTWDEIFDELLAVLPAPVAAQCEDMIRNSFTSFEGGSSIDILEERVGRFNEYNALKLNFYNKFGKTYKEVDEMSRLDESGVMAAQAIANAQKVKYEDMLKSIDNILRTKEEYKKLNWKVQTQLGLITQFIDACRGLSKDPKLNQVMFNAMVTAADSMTQYALNTLTKAIIGRDNGLKGKHLDYAGGLRGLILDTVGKDILTDHSDSDSYSLDTALENAIYALKDEEWDKVLTKLIEEQDKMIHSFSEMNDEYIPGRGGDGKPKWLARSIQDMDKLSKVYSDGKVLHSRYTLKVDQDGKSASLVSSLGDDGRDLGLGPESDYYFKQRDDKSIEVSEYADSTTPTGRTISLVARYVYAPPSKRDSSGYIPGTSMVWGQLKAVTRYAEKGKPEEYIEFDEDGNMVECRRKIGMGLFDQEKAAGYVHKAIDKKRRTMRNQGFDERKISDAVTRLINADGNGLISLFSGIGEYLGDKTAEEYLRLIDEKENVIEEHRHKIAVHRRNLQDNLTKAYRALELQESIRKQIDLEGVQKYLTFDPRTGRYITRDKMNIAEGEIKDNDRDWVPDNDPGTVRDHMLDRYYGGGLYGGSNTNKPEFRAIGYYTDNEGSDRFVSVNESLFAQIRKIMEKMTE